MKPLILLAAMLAATGAAAQTANVGNENASTSAVIIEGGGPGHRETTLRTNPDANAAPVMTTNISCYVGQGSVAVGSYLFGGVSGSRTTLDEGCEARADSRHLADLAVTRARVFGDVQRGLVLMAAAERRMGMTREAFEAAFPAASPEPWEQLWRP
jgi:hypothetical protein